MVTVVLTPKAGAVNANAPGPVKLGLGPKRLFNGSNCAAKHGPGVEATTSEQSVESPLRMK
jgi:hypothetical protein